MANLQKISFTPVTTGYASVEVEFYDRGGIIISHEIIATEPMILFTATNCEGDKERMLAKASVISQISGRCYFAPFLGCLLSKLDSGRLSLWTSDQVEEAAQRRTSKNKLGFFRTGMSCLGLM